MDYKECELGSNKPFDEVMNGFLPALEDYYNNPRKYNIEPFKIFGNLYYVGDKKVCMHLSPMKNDEICWPDETISDGDIIKLGNSKIRCVSAPGHTPGTMAFFFEASDGVVNHKVGYLGGVGFLSIFKEFCRRYNLPQNMCQELKATAVRLECEDVEILLGNHPNHNCLIEKREYMTKNKSANPFINKDSWKIFLCSIMERCIDFERHGY